jgi:hypothetical protein
VCIYIYSYIQVASSVGDGALAQTALKLLEKNGYDIGYSDYLCLAHACLGGKDTFIYVCYKNMNMWIWIYICRHDYEQI